MYVFFSLTVAHILAYLTRILSIYYFFLVVSKQHVLFSFQIQQESCSCFLLYFFPVNYLTSFKFATICWLISLNLWLCSELIKLTSLDFFDIVFQVNVTWKNIKVQLLNLKNNVRLRPSRTDSVAEKLIHSSISPRLEYCSGVLFGPVPNKTLDSFQYVQNSAARVLAPGPGSTSPPTVIYLHRLLVLLFL